VAPYYDAAMRGRRDTRAARRHVAARAREPDRTPPEAPRGSGVEQVLSLKF